MPRREPFSMRTLSFPTTSLFLGSPVWREGRALHARGKGIGSTRAYPPWATRPSLTDVVGMRCLGLCAASQRGRTECVPPRKPPFASSGGSARQATGLGPGLPPEGRALHARSDGIGLAGACPIWPPGVRFPPIIMLCLGMSKALPRGRGDRAPPRKSPSASAPGFPRGAILAWIAPAEGRAPHARKRSHHANRNIATFWPRPLRRPAGDDEMPWFAPGPYFRTRRAHPSEKTASHIISGVSPQGRLTPPNPLRGAGSARPRNLRSELSHPSVKPNEILKRNALDFQSRFCFAPN